MVKLHATRLMANGEVALWSKGQLVWSGVVGAHVSSMSFDAISMHVDDSVRMRAAPGDQPTAALVLGVLAARWDSARRHTERNQSTPALLLLNSPPQVDTSSFSAVSVRTD